MNCFIATGYVKGDVRIFGIIDLFGDIIAKYGRRDHHFVFIVQFGVSTTTHCLNKKKIRNCSAGYWVRSSTSNLGNFIFRAKSPRAFVKWGGQIKWSVYKYRTKLRNTGNFTPRIWSKGVVGVLLVFLTKRSWNNNMVRRGSQRDSTMTLSDKTWEKYEKHSNFQRIVGEDLYHLPMSMNCFSFNLKNQITVHLTVNQWLKVEGKGTHGTWMPEKTRQRAMSNRSNQFEKNLPGLTTKVCFHPAATWETCSPCSCITCLGINWKRRSPWPRHPVINRSISNKNKKNSLRKKKLCGFRNDEKNCFSSLAFTTSFLLRSVHNTTHCPL